MNVRAASWQRICLAVLILGGTAVLMTWLYVHTERSLEAARNGQSKALTASLEGLPPAVSLLNNRGVEHARKGRLDRAIACFRYAAREWPDYLPARRNLLAACVETGR